MQSLPSGWLITSSGMLQSSGGRVSPTFRLWPFTASIAMMSVKYRHSNALTHFFTFIVLVSLLMKNFKTGLTYLHLICNTEEKRLFLRCEEKNSLAFGTVTAVMLWLSTERPDAVIVMP